MMRVDRLYLIESGSTTLHKALAWSQTIKNQSGKKIAAECGKQQSWFRKNLRMLF